MLTPRFRQQGFTAVELMVTLSVLAIMSALAMPGFQTLMAENRARSKSIEVVSALQTAQAEAKTRNRMVMLAFTDSPMPSTNLTASASGKTWATVVLPLSSTGMRDVITVGGSQENTADVKLTPSTSAVCFLPDGTLKNLTSTALVSGADCTVDDSSGTSLLVEPSRGEKAWQITISPAGKISTCVGKLTSSTFTCT